jgi:hypothetical protein
VPSSASYYVNPTDPLNANDPLKGMYIFERNIPVYATATQTVSSLHGAPIVSYVQQTVSVRGAPLFAHAIFYNMDLELNPGPTMTISGPVHTNGNLFIMSAGSSLNFQGTVSATGNVYHAFKYLSTTTIGEGSLGANGGINTNTSPVNILNTAGTSVDVYGEVNGQSSNTWDDSTLGASTAINGTLFSSEANYTASLAAAATANEANFRTDAMMAWNGNLMTSAMGVENYTPSAIGTYAEQTTTTSDNSVNSAHAIIEPPTATTSAQYDADVEQQKFSNKAGVYIQVTPSTASPTITTTTVGSVVTTTTAYPAGSIAVYTGGPPTSSTSHLVTNPSVSNLVTYAAYKETKTVSGGSTSFVVNSGLYDQHNGSVTTSSAAGANTGEMDMVNVDMNGLRNVVSQITASTPITSEALDGLTANNWTGVVYVEVVGDPTTNVVATGSVVAGSTNAATNSRAPNVGVQMINGNGAAATFGSINPGLTVATDAPLYVLGNYNATSTTVNSSTPTTPVSGETPDCLAGDAVTLLSSGFSAGASKSTVSPTASVTNDVVASAILTGETPTNKNGNAIYSGGAHNLPRFLENWSGKTVYIRGSLVCLYESRVADVPFNLAYYSPPGRAWGFNSLFGSGDYPPGTPTVISYRRTDYFNITHSQYTAAQAAN